MDDLDLYALGGMVNRSSAMFDRRRKILAEARALIGQDGGDFSIRKLAENSGVSTRTIYNAFGNKDAVVSLAIGQYFDDFYRTMHFDEPLGTLEGAIERQIATTRRNLDIPKYVHALAELYFQPRLGDNVRSTLAELAARPYRDWLHRSALRRELVAGQGVERILVALAHLQYGTVCEWIAGGFGDRELVQRTVSAVLTHLTGAFRGTASQAARRMLAELLKGEDGFSQMNDRAARQLRAARLEN